MSSDPRPVDSSRVRDALRPRCWARRFAGLCKLGFVAVVLLAALVVFAGLGVGHEVALFWGTVTLALVVISAAELAQHLAWRLDPLARLCLLAFVAALDVMQLGAVALVILAVLRG